MPCIDILFNEISQAPQQNISRSLVFKKSTKTTRAFKVTFVVELLRLVILQRLG